VVAVAAGNVVIAESLPEFGNVVVVDHGGGCTTLSAHLWEMLVATGDAVTRGHVLGRVGSTGRATGPHLHFETRLNGAPQDPTSVLPAEGDPAEAMRIELIATMRGVLAGVRDVVLVGTTLHDNAGDSLIWLGQLAVLAELGIRVHAVVHPASFDRRPFDAAPPGAVVLLSGGGNFGDLWPFVHRHREWILQEITDRRIVQFPQSLHFRDDAAVARVQHSLAARDDVSLMWRDRQSLGAARDLFPGVDAHLVPDVAFARRPPRVPVSPGDRIVWIARDDREGSALRRSSGPSGRVTDWGLDRAPALARELLWLTARVERRVPSVVGPRPRLVLYNRSALMTAHAAARLVAGARVVVTDRLHAHVLCTMFAVPHVLLDDGYGKIRAFLDTWPVTGARAELAASPEDAAERAARLLAGTYAEVK
jgi:pyruvyl transferase EpsO